MRRPAYLVGASALRLLGLVAGCPAMCEASAGVDAPAVRYAPVENLERIDVALIDQAKTSIDTAAYVLTDWAVIQALTGAADRGVAIRIYLDGRQFSPSDPSQPLRQFLALWPETARQ